MRGIIVLGSNWGCREKNIDRAVACIVDNCEITKRSHVYESPDCKGSGKRYLNVVMEIETSLREDTFNDFLKSIECKCGRTPEMRAAGNVPIDIDIVIWNNEIRRMEDFNALYFKEGYSKIS